IGPAPPDRARRGAGGPCPCRAQPRGPGGQRADRGAPSRFPAPLRLRTAAAVPASLEAASLQPDLRGLDHLAGLEAPRADAQVHAAAVQHRVDALQVGQGALLRLVVRVAHLVAGEWTLAAHVALERHLSSGNGATYAGIPACQVAETCLRPLRSSACVAQARAARMEPSRPKPG